MILYTIGLIFSADLETVYLIRKKSPDWQAGKLNGVGGKLEKNETPLSCMEREAMEEAGYAGEWEELAYMHGEHSANGDPVWKCGVYYSVMAPGAELPHTCEAENIEPHRVADVPALAPEMMQHTPMLIMAALAHIRGDAFKLEVSY